MANEIAKIEGGLPAELAAAFGAVESNIVVAEKTPQLSIKGKVWKIMMEGNETPLMKKDADGEMVPENVIKVIILNQVVKRSRVYFPDSYTEDSKAQPACWSINGDAPDPTVPTPISDNCGNCEYAIKGSKISDSGEPTTACSTNKRIVVIPANNAEFTPLLLKLPVTSLWEKEESEKAQGWMAFDSYLKFLKANNVQHTGAVITAMKFDAKESYPKVLFKYSGFVDPDMASQIIPRINSQEVIHTLGLDRYDMEPVHQPAVEETSNTNVAPPAEEESSVDVSGFGDAGETEALAKTAKSKTTTKKKKATKKTKQQEEVAAAEVADEPAAEVAENDSELDSIMSSWG